MADLRFCMSALPPKADMCSTNTLSRTLIDRSLGDPALASDTVQARCAALTPTREHCDHDTKEIICLCAKDREISDTASCVCRARDGRRIHYLGDQIEFFHCSACRIECCLSRLHGCSYDNLE